MLYGSRVKGQYKTLYPATLGDTKPGEVFDFEIEVEDFSDENAAITQILTLEQTTPDLKVLYAETNPQTRKINVQMMDTGPGSWSIAAILTNIPSLLIVAGIIVAGILVYQIYMSPTGWLLPALVIIGGGVLIYYFVGRGFVGGQDAFAPKTMKMESEAEKETREEQKAERIRIKIQKENKAALDARSVELEKIEDAYSKAVDEEEHKRLIFDEAHNTYARCLQAEKAIKKDTAKKAKMRQECDDKRSVVDDLNADYRKAVAKSKSLETRRSALMGVVETMVDTMPTEALTQEQILDQQLKIQKLRDLQTKSDKREIANQRARQKFNL
jgi:hypothetical protein